MSMADKRSPTDAEKLARYGEIVRLFNLYRHDKLANLANFYRDVREVLRREYVDVDEEDKV